ncbi:hypothetical protein F2P81_002675 [Scophthalmus maximus]|uniref:Uncharacterized protein n=1 Tax=Scophthalmus maximus TaxID=52904 RepID=A0A6A4TF02_SCOMX|nr:hypothetical protein F2P81_002675 [Scophthalmus maximus]
MPAARGRNGEVPAKRTVAHDAALYSVNRRNDTVQSNVFRCDSMNDKKVTFRNLTERQELAVESTVHAGNSHLNSLTSEDVTPHGAAATFAPSVLSFKGHDFKYLDRMRSHERPMAPHAEPL